MAKNNKKSNQKKSVLNKLGGLSKRSKFIVVVLIFAVLGGGYLTYKSFAATRYTENIATGESENLYAYGPIKCDTSRVNDPAKNNAVVMNIYCPKRNDVTTTYNVTNRLNNSDVVSKGYQQACVMMKGVGTFSIDVGGNGYARYSINESNYKEYCSKALYYGANVGDFKIKNMSGKVEFTTKEVQLVSIRYLATYRYPGTAPPPASGK